MPYYHPLVVVAAILLLAPYLTAAFLPRLITGCARRLPNWAQIAAPAYLALPYSLVAVSAGTLEPGWCALYVLLPPAIALAAKLAPADERTIWPQLIILAVLGLSVDLRWFERAWPSHLAIFNKVLLLDAGIYAFVALRPIAGTGFDLRLRIRDLINGLREFLLYLPIALALGFALGFLHTHRLEAAAGLMAGRFVLAWLFTFFFIAVPEELFFRGWLQNLLERRMGRTAALIAASLLFGLSHFNKRTAFFNWRYVLLAAIAGVFYGRAWRRDHRVAASAVTHSTVDAIWSLFLR
jgi:membrane protease YdiL (CAAX protease family)